MSHISNNASTLYLNPLPAVVLILTGGTVQYYSRTKYPFLQIEAQTRLSSNFVRASTVPWLAEVEKSGSGCEPQCGGRKYRCEIGSKIRIARSDWLTQPFLSYSPTNFCYGAAAHFNPGLACSSVPHPIAASLLA